MRKEVTRMENERFALANESIRLENERFALANESIRLENERFALANESTRLENERRLLEQERERWEKAREDRIPQDAFWETVYPAPDCRAYGKREYSGALRNIPGGWTDVDACMNMPVEIKGVSVRRPYRCGYVEGSPHIRGYWMVDWDQSDCKPWYRDFHDNGCSNRGSGTRSIEAQIVGIPTGVEQDWRLLCETTPMTWDYITYKGPTRCEIRLYWKKSRDVGYPR